MHKLDYLWLDGCTPTQIRYKTKVVKDFGNSVVGVPISPHDNKPVHIAVAAMGNPLVLTGGIPTNRMGDLDSCGHVRIMGAATVLC